MIDYYSSIRLLWRKNNKSYSDISKLNIKILSIMNNLFQLNHL